MIVGVEVERFVYDNINKLTVVILHF